MSDLIATEPWEDRLCRLIEKYDGARDGVSFRHDFSATLAEGKQGGALTDEKVALLMRARSLIEGWSDPERKEQSAPQQVFAEWDAFYSDAREQVSDMVLECVLRRFPISAPGSLDWSRYLLDDVRPGLIDVLLSRRLVRKEDVNRLSGDRPDELYQSRLLDAFIKRGGALPEPMWERVAEDRPTRAAHVPRPAGTALIYE